jgi:hypothetical protein
VREPSPRARRGNFSSGDTRNDVRSSPRVACTPCLARSAILTTTAVRDTNIAALSMSQSRAHAADVLCSTSCFIARQNRFDSPPAGDRPEMRCALCDRIMVRERELTCIRIRTQPMQPHTRRSRSRASSVPRARDSLECRWPVSYADCATADLVMQATSP